MSLRIKIKAMLQKERGYLGVKSKLRHCTKGHLLIQAIRLVTVIKVNEKTK